MTVAMPTTPGNYFHLLRWQGLSGRHKPLIVFTPKSMLRLKAATSAVSDFTTGSFRPLVGSPAGLGGAGDADVRRVLLCAGKVYYDLAARRRAVQDESGRGGETAIVRVERLYPLPASELRTELARYPNAESITWVQEEPANMGAWPTMALKLPRVLGREVGVICLPASSAPAAGSAAKHASSHREIIETAIPSA
jgi:2-oxoglutarate decarboxylase